MSGEDILRIYRDGDRERAFNELVKSYSERLYWHVRELVGSHDDTDDLMQDIFVKIWTALPTFRGDAQLFTWIWRIATNEAINHLKKQRLRNMFSGGDQEEAERVPDRSGHLDGDRAQRLLSVAISKLPPRQRAVFTMRYFEEMKYEDISEILDTSVSSLKASYHFAYEKVKEYLKKNIDE